MFLPWIVAMSKARANAVGRSRCSCVHRPAAFEFATSIDTGMSTAIFLPLICLTSTPPLESGFLPPSDTQSAVGTSSGTGTAVFAVIDSGTRRARLITAEPSTDFSKIGPTSVSGRKTGSIVFSLIGLVAAIGGYLSQWPRSRPCLMNSANCAAGSLGVRLPLPEEP